MNPIRKLDKITDYLNRDLLSMREAGDGVLLMLSSTEEPLLIYGAISGRLADEVNERLSEIASGLLWQPFVFGEPISAEEVERINASLSEFFETVSNEKRKEQ